jgi:hypothetical protein
LGHAREVEMAAGAELFPGLDQALMDRVELVSARRDDLPLDRLLEPGPLKHRGLEDRGRGVRVIFQQLCRASPVETEIQSAIKAGFVAVPAIGHQRPVSFRYPQRSQVFFVADDAIDQFEAHRVDFAGRRFNLALDLIQRESIIGALVPVALAIQRMKIKSASFGRRPPVVALGAGDTLH